MICGRFTSRIARFLINQCGALAVSFAIAAPALMIVAGMATDYAFMVRFRTELQAVADAAAIAGAREMTLAQSDPDEVDAVVESYVAVNAKNRRGGPVTTTTQVNSKDSSVEVSLSQTWTPFMLHLLESGVTPIVVHATARTVGAEKVCVIGLDENAGDTVYLTDKATVTANNCAVYSDSVASNSLEAGSKAFLKSSLTCTAGGYVGAAGSFDPQPVTDCPKISDPLADRTAPSVGSCDFYKLSISSKSVTLSPGVYCGGLHITKSSTVELNSGTYIIKKGALTVDGASTLTGEHVGFYLTQNATFSFTKDSVINLSAPKDGQMAGLLFFEDRSNNPGLNNKITSDNARYLLGTIYLSQGTLMIDSSKTVADQSAYTAIVARSLKLKAGPNLVLNSDYNATDVPVPSGLMDLAGGRIVLSN